MTSVVSNLFGKGVEGLAVFGVLAVSYISLKVAYSIFSGVSAFLLSSGINFRKLGEWAVVTGATDGIGKAYAQELAKKGMNIVLISRSPEKLGDVAAEIESKSNVKTKVIPIDFTGGIEIYDKIKQEVTGLDIGVLVNNVGMSYSYPDFFGNIPDDKTVMNILNVNMTSVTMMTRVFLPSMLDKKKGAIINIASSSAVFPVPLITEYSATKAYMDFFSRGLQAEYASKGIIIQSVCPFFVATKLSKIRKTSIFVPSPSDYAKSAINTVGVQSRTFGCMSHAIQGYVSQCLPEWLLPKIAMNGGLKARSRALKKLQKTE